VARASGVAAAIDVAALPVLDGARELAVRGAVAGGTKRNLQSAAAFTTVDEGVAEVDRVLVADAQTSGGLLVAVAPHRVAALVEAMRAAGTPAAAVIGRIAAGEAGRVTVR
jgi:selenide,water dikinase